MVRNGLFEPFFNGDRWDSLNRLCLLYIRQRMEVCLLLLEGAFLAV